MNPDNFTIYQDTFDGFDVWVQVERMPEVMEKVNAVSSFIAALSLTCRENDKLVGLLTDLVNAMEHSAYLQGVVFGRYWLSPAGGREDGAWAEK